MVKKQTAEVFFSPTARRRYFTRKAAINAEARAIIYKKYPREALEEDTGHFYDIALCEPERYEKMMRRLKRLVAN